ncbi:dienelactone hydrolase family protein [Janthinobacterium sp. HH01]|uniref:acyl-CoA thioester hydrolase/BAAT C-terminal domain-containing protein n=1 Tax=Janthinobacterium sp. HH01 TaxID=1198452 RepID=UPI0002AEE1E3|nr:acyl-CoA thioester hydrolase/BAAT C-terminal domain-containing protein [Janthinobacterium sp. HH01]ELX09433.1 dienelactone hydrolase family protein [Janthinobacterium sp. HH01]
MKRIILLATLWTGLASHAQTLTIAPAGPVLTGDPVSITLSGLPPKADVQIVAERLMKNDAQPVLYRAEAAYRSDAEGKLDLAQSAPRSGSYRKADVRGLFWSMTPSKDAPAAGMVPGVVQLSARIDGKEVAHARMQFVNTLPEVKVEAVDAFPGAVFAALPGSGRRPVIIVLGGSEGGSSAVRELAPMLAAHGYAVLGLPYYSPAAWNSTERELPMLPRSFVDIPVDRLEQARTWLAARSDVDAAHIGLLGYSKGAEFALIAASKMPWISAVAAIAATDVVWQGWGPDVNPPDSRRSSFSWRGQALPFVPNQDFLQEMAGFQTGADVRYRRPQDKGRAAHPEAAVAARIRVEDFKGALLVAGGIEDQMWASGMMAQNIAERRAAAGRDTVSLVYTDAGHVLNGSGWSPTTQYDAGPFKTGGTPEANARAQADTWRQTLAFFKRSL